MAVPGCKTLLTIFGLLLVLGLNPRLGRISAAALPAPDHAGESSATAEADGNLTASPTLPRSIPVSTNTDSSENAGSPEVPLRTLLLVLLSGIVAALLCYNTALYLAMGDRSYLACLVYSALVITVQIWVLGSTDTLSSEWALPLRRLAGILPSCLTLSLIHLAREFLRIAERQPWMDRLLSSCIGLTVLQILILPFMDRDTMQLQFTYQLFIYALLSIACLKGRRKDATSSLVFLLSLIPPYFGTVLILMQGEHWQTLTPWRLVGLTLQILILSVGLSLRVLEMRRDYLKHLESAREELARNVKQRTSELAERNRQLSLEIVQRQKAETTLKDQQALILQDSKIRALGEMAGGIAHEINNPLMIIAGYSEMIIKLSQKDPAPIPRIREVAQRTIETSRRIAGIIQALRNYSHQRQHEDVEILSVRNLVQQTLALCSGRLSGQGIIVRTDSIDPDARVAADGGLLLQVFYALVANAADAMSTSLSKELEIRVERCSGRVCIAVIDSGPGVPAALSEKIYQPFFTTKELGKGLGLGLSASLGVVQSLKGELKHKRIDGLTVFEVSLPEAPVS